MPKDAERESERVGRILRTMSLGPQPVDLSFAQRWTGEEHKLETIRSIASVLEDPDPTDESLDVLASVHRFIDELEKERDNLVGVLVKLKLTWSNACAAVEYLICCLRAGVAEQRVKPCSSPDTKGSYVIGSKDILSLFYQLSRTFFNKSNKNLILLRDEDLRPFYILLHHICKRADDKLGERFKLYDYLEDGDAQCYLAGSDEAACPAIITEDADSHAAVDSIVESLCRAQIQAVCSVSHVLVQESVWDVTVSLLKHRLSGLRVGPREDKATQLLEIHPRPEQAELAFKNLEIFMPSDKCPVRLCIGWNPRDFGQERTFRKSRGFVVVLPWRNHSELGCLLRENTRGPGPASVWGLSGGSAPLPHALTHQFSVLWINCHGFMDPLAPGHIPKLSPLSKGKHFDKTDLDWPFKFSESVRSSPYLAMAVSALKSKTNYSEWLQSNSTALADLLQLLNSHLDEVADCSKCRLSDLVSEEAVGSASAWPQRPCLRRWRGPAGVVRVRCAPLVLVPSAQHLHSSLVLSSIANGNVVILSAANAEDLNFLNEAYKSVKSLLPPGCLTIDCEGDAYGGSPGGVMDCDVEVGVGSERCTLLDHGLALGWSLPLSPRAGLCYRTLLSLTSRQHSVWCA